MAIKKTIEIDVSTIQAVGGLDNLSKALEKVDASAKGVDATFEEVYGDLKPLTARMGEAEDRLYELALAGQSASQEYKDLLASVGQYRKVQMQTDMVVDAAATTFDSKLGGALQGVTSTFAGVQGAMALTGSQSVELEEALLKVQGAMALAEGVRGIREGVTSFKALGTSAKAALSGIRTGIAATGIGLLLVALGGIVAYWDDIKEAVNGVSAEQESLNAKVQTNLEAEQAKLDTIGSQDNVLKLQGKSEKDILKIKLAQTDQVIKATEAQITQNDITAKAQIEAAQRNKDILKGILDFLSIPFQTVLKTIDMIGSAVGKDFGLSEGFTKLLDKGASLVFDPVAEKAAADATRKESLNALNKLKNDRAGLVLSIRNIDNQASKEAADKAKENADKAMEAELDKLNKQSEILAQGREINKQNNEKVLEDLKAFGQKKGEELQTQLTNQVNATKAASEEELRIAQATADGKKAIEEASFAVAENGLNLLKGLFTKNKAIQKGVILAESALGIARIVTSTQAANAADRAAAALMGPAGAAYLATKLVINKVGAGIGIASNLAATSKALNALGGGGAKGGAGGGTNSGPSGSASMPTPTFNVVGNSGVNQIAQTLGSQQPVQAYVVANNVTTAQALDRNIIQNASMG
jgi:hypothetical protein